MLVLLSTRMYSIICLFHYLWRKHEDQIQSLSRLYAKIERQAVPVEAIHSVVPWWIRSVTEIKCRPYPESLASHLNRESYLWVHFTENSPNRSIKLGDTLKKPSCSRLWACTKWVRGHESIKHISSARTDIHRHTLTIHIDSSRWCRGSHDTHTYYTHTTTKLLIRHVLV